MTLDFNEIEIQIFEESAGTEQYSKSANFNEEENDVNEDHPEHNRGEEDGRGEAGPRRGPEKAFNCEQNTSFSAAYSFLFCKQDVVNLPRIDSTVRV